MFTGIIEEVGRVVNRSQNDHYETFMIAGQKVLADLVQGHSIAVNGVCLTVIGRSEDTFSVQVVPETLARSNLDSLHPGDRVNLERSLKANDRFHGHMVQGHIETVGYISDITMEQHAVRMSIAIGAAWLEYCIPKGSIAIEGVSLTIADLSATGITVALIPYTLTETTLGKKQIGDAVNVETDVLARYLARFLEAESEEESEELNLDHLHSWGFGES